MKINSDAQEYRQYTHEDQWFSVDIAGNNQLKVRIACNPEDEDDFIITGLKNNTYEFSVE